VNVERKAVFYKAISSSALSKLVSFVYQIVSIPLLISMIGTHNFGILAMMMSLIGWINILSGGVSPYVTKVISEERPFVEQQRVITGTRTLLFWGSLALVTVFSVMSFYIYTNYGNLVITAYLLFVMSILIINFTIADSIRQGSKQQHINNFYMMSANLAIIGAIYLTYSLPVSEEYLLPLAVIVLYLPLLVSKLVNFYTIDNTFFLKGFYLPFKNNKQTFKKIFHFMLANFMIQLSVVIIKSFAIIYLGVSDTLAAAKMEIIFRYLLISGTFFAAIQLPLWPLITEAKAKKDHVWLNEIKIWLGAGFFLYGLVNFIIMFYFGLAIFDLWLGQTVKFTQQEIVLSGGYFLLISVVQAPVILLMGHGAFSYMGKVLMIEAVLFLLFIMAALFLNSAIDLSMILLSMILLRLFAFTLLYQRAYKAL